MNQFVLDNYVRSQGVYRLEYLEYQVDQDKKYKENDVSLDQLIYLSYLDGYEELKSMLDKWFERSNIPKEDVIEYMFMKAHPELFNNID